MYSAGKKKKKKKEGQKKKKTQEEMTGHTGTPNKYVRKSKSFKWKERISSGNILISRTEGQHNSKRTHLGVKIIRCGHYTVDTGPPVGLCYWIRARLRQTVVEMKDVSQRTNQRSFPPCPPGEVFFIFKIKCCQYSVKLRPRTERTSSPRRAHSRPRKSLELRGHDSFT